MSSEDDNNTFANDAASPEDAPKPARKRAVKKKAAKKATKKAAKKVARKKAVSSEAKVPEQSDMFADEVAPAASPNAEVAAPKVQARVERELVPAEVPTGSARASGVVWSSDDPEPVAESQPAARSAGAAQSEAAAPSEESPSEARQDDGKPRDTRSREGKPQGRRNEPSGGQRQQQRRERGGERGERGGERPGRNGKFKNKGGHAAGHQNKKGKGRWANKKKHAREEDTPIEFGELLHFELFEEFEAILKLAEEMRSGSGAELDFNRIYDMGLPELRAEVAAAEVELPHAPNRDQLLNVLIAQAGEAKVAIASVGIFEPLEDDAGGLLVYERDNYRVKALSAYVPQAFVERYGLQRGHIVKAQLHPHREHESCPFVVSIQQVMDRDPETLSEIVPFTEGIPYYPLQRILMESDTDSKADNLSMRVVDCLTPVGFGQRGLIVAPPRTGKTVLMQGMANSIQKNYPDAHLIILLIDERPEEVTDFRRQVSGEVISSTFDESAESHVHAAEMVIEKARRMVEVGQDVVILLDSITRLARAYNTTMPNSGKILSGGVEANALQKPKRFFGSARNIEGGGSLTIIATALVETGSKMDEVIFEEFKGTGNMELHLDRGLSDKRIFPALSMDKSGTRKEELLYHPDEMLKIYSLRRAMKGLPSTDAMEMLIQRIKKTNTNAEFLMSVSR
jgi:transcription termination factor Rho